MREVECYGCGAIIDKVGSYTSEVDVEVGTSSGRSSGATFGSVGLAAFGKNKIPSIRIGQSSGRSFNRTNYRTKKIYKCADCAAIAIRNGVDPGDLVVDKSSSAKALNDLSVGTNTNLGAAFNVALNDQAFNHHVLQSAGIGVMSDAPIHRGTMGTMITHDQYVANQESDVVKQARLEWANEQAEKARLRKLQNEADDIEWDNSIVGKISKVTLSPLVGSIIETWVNPKRLIMPVIIITSIIVFLVSH